MKRSHTLLMLVASCTLALALPALANAKPRDRNHDRIPDRWEKRHHLSLAVDQARRDQDRDRLRNLAEFEAGTNPRSADSDGDGIPDGKEHAGTIASFDPTSGELTIELFGGGSVTGLVDEETEIECDDSGAEASSAASSSEDDEGDDEDRPEGEAGDDEQGEQSGEDDGAEEEPADDDGAEEGDAQGPGSSCTTADLVPGATVDEAELKLANGGATFEKVELDG